MLLMNHTRQIQQIYSEQLIPLANKIAVLPIQ